MVVLPAVVDSGCDVLSIHIAAGLSGTCESAREAARVLAEEGASGGSRCSIARPAPAASAAWWCWRRASPGGREPSEHRARACARGRESLDIWFCLDTLEYLRRGGRIGAAQAMVGTALKIKPILTFGTEIAPVGACARTGARSSGWSAYLARAARARRQRLDRPARPGPRRCRAARGRGHRAVRLRAAVLHRGRPGARRAPRLGHPRRRDGRGRAIRRSPPGTAPCA